MEYLVTMTTHVPEGTPQDAVDDIRDRESVRSRELAKQGYLVRLWRPPLQPGEWRSLGLFAADDDSDLQLVLASMPLRVWRSDEVTPLSPHPNDPAHGITAATPEFLTIFTITIPEGTPIREVGDTEAREAARAKELAHEDHLERLWVLPGDGRALGLWRARDAEEMKAIVQSLPMDSWMTTEITSLSPHPSDPVVSGQSPIVTGRLP